MGNQPQSVVRLNALALAEIEKATERYLVDNDPVRWERSVAQTLAKAHQAAYLVGASERLGVPVDSPLLNSRNLSRAEREELNQIVQTQIDFLTRFVDVADGLSPDQISNRASLYALAPKQTYWQGWAGEELECLPGGCEECFGNCRCTLSREPDGVHWLCADDDRSCSACSTRGATWPLDGGSDSLSGADDNESLSDTDELIPADEVA